MYGDFQKGLIGATFGMGLGYWIIGMVIEAHATILIASIYLMLATVYNVVRRLL